MKFDPFGYKRIRELFEESEQKSAKIRELEKALRYKQMQHKGYGRELEKQLKQIEELKAAQEELLQEQNEWIAMYQASEQARASLGEKLNAQSRDLERAMGAIELIRRCGANAPSVAAASGCDSSPEGGAMIGGARA